jgi:hypothetical protein
LLMVLFLPVEELADPRLDDLLLQLRCVSPELQRYCPADLGIPFVLACASRYPLGGRRHPLSFTRKRHLEVSRQLVQTILGENPEPLAHLRWLMIEDARTDGTGEPPAHPCSPCFQDQGQRLNGVRLDQLLTLSSLPSSPSLPLDNVDPLEGRQALYLSWRDGTDPVPAACYEKRVRRLMEKGIPFIWRDSPALAIPEATTDPPQEAPSHPLDEMVSWEGKTFQDRYYRWSSRFLSQQEEADSAVYRYLRAGVLFWEDHRFLPPMQAARPLRSPYLTS